MGGVLRRIALATVDALCTWRCRAFLGAQPVIVAVGRIALGRVFNVVGSVVDALMELVISCQFNTGIGIETASGALVESCEDLTYPLAYPNHYMGWIVLYTPPEQPQIGVVCSVSSSSCT